MAINLRAPDFTELKPRILVFGVGGAGSNAVNNMVDAELEGVEFIVANTDAQALAHSKAPRRIQIGTQVTQGLGAGARPDVGLAAAEESLDEIRDCIQGAHMVFITAGMGGGTGTGAAPVIAKAAREAGILTVGVVTKPFAFEGQRRMRLAEDGIARLQTNVDTLIVIPNQNLFRVANEKTTFAKAFAMADDVLYSGVRGITDLMVMPGLINLDFADVRTVMSEMGKAMMGTGEADGEKRAIRAAEAAISNPLLDHSSMKGARGVLINITGGTDLTLFEVDEAANKIRAEVDPDANIIVGSTFDDSLEGAMRVSVVATGIETEAARMPKSAAEVVRAVTSAATADARGGAQTMRGQANTIPALDTPQAASTRHPVHQMQSELVQSGLATPSETQRVLSEARQVAAQVAAQAKAQAALQSPDLSFERASASPKERKISVPSDGYPLDLGAIGQPIDDAHAPRTRRSGAGQKHVDSNRESEGAKKRSALSFLGDLGNSLGLTGSGAKRIEPLAEEESHLAPRRVAFGSGGQGEGFAQAPAPDRGPVIDRGSAQQSRPAKAARISSVQPGRMNSDDTSADDHLEIPAFLRRQAN